MKSTSRNLLLLATVQMAVSLYSVTSSAIAAFARKEGVSCMTCHTVVPKLNKVGFEYRGAGYRMPDKIGVEDSPKDLSQSMSARAAVSATNTDATGKNVISTMTATGGSIYALAGGWGTNFGSLIEFGLSSKTAKSGSDPAATVGAAGSITAMPEISVNDLQLRATFGEADKHWNYRVGQLPLLEGYGAMDRQLAGTTGAALAPVVSATATGSATGWAGKAIGTSATTTPGFEIGYTYFDTEVALASTNGLEYDPIDKTLHAYGNGFSARSDLDPLVNSRDLLFRFNQFLGKKNAISGYYYQGNVSLPLSYPSKTTTPAQLAYSTATYSTDAFTRMGLYGTYWITDEMTLMLGYLAGTDNFSALTSAVSGSGEFLAMDFYRGETSAVGFRYDTYNQSVDSGWDLNAADVYYTTYWKTGLYTKVDFQNLDTGAGANAARSYSRKLTMSLTYNF